MDADGKSEVHILPKQLVTFIDDESHGKKGKQNTSKNKSKTSILLGHYPP